MIIPVIGIGEIHKESYQPFSRAKKIYLYTRFLAQISGSFYTFHKAFYVLSFAGSTLKTQKNKAGLAVRF